MTEPKFQLDNAFVEDADPTLHLVASKLRPSAKFVRFRLTDEGGHQYWFIQKQQAKVAPNKLLGLGVALLWSLHMRWRATFAEVEIIIPTVVSERTCDVSGKTEEHIYSDTFVVKNFNQNVYDASAVNFRTPSYVGVWLNRDFDDDAELPFVRTIDQDGRILELTFHAEVEDFSRGVVSIDKVMQEVADALYSSVGLLVRSMEYITPQSGERTTYYPVYLPAE